mmetsp:Transcript_30162/g.71887  ORF Transcript_30162/g.71887 Transcript_30162/m.71887 type:complete len:81 (+) Transcript_30162:1066-1308(+)
MWQVWLVQPDWPGWLVQTVLQAHQQALLPHHSKFPKPRPVRGVPDLDKQRRGLALRIWTWAILERLELPIVAEACVTCLG